MGRRANRAVGVLAAFLVVGSLLAGQAFAEGCGRAAPPTVALELSSNDIREDFDTTGAELRRAADSRGIQPHWPALGVVLGAAALVNYLFFSQRRIRAPQHALSFGFYSLRDPTLRIFCTFFRV
jgi:hypothetical protein